MERLNQVDLAEDGGSFELMGEVAKVGERISIRLGLIIDLTEIRTRPVSS